MDDIDYSFTDELVCPYCGYSHDDDGEMNEAGTYNCSKCDKMFNFEVDYSKSYSSRKVPCLNGEPHKFKKEFYPGYPDYQRCRACDKRIPGEREKVVL